MGKFGETVKGHLKKYDHQELLEYAHDKLRDRVPYLIPGNSAYYFIIGLSHLSKKDPRASEVIELGGQFALAGLELIKHDPKPYNAGLIAEDIAMVHLSGNGNGVPSIVERHEKEYPWLQRSLPGQYEQMRNEQLVEDEKYWLTLSAWSVGLVPDQRRLEWLHSFAQPLEWSGWRGEGYSIFSACISEGEDGAKAALLERLKNYKRRPSNGRPVGSVAPISWDGYLFALGMKAQGFDLGPILDNKKYGFMIRYPPFCTWEQVKVNLAWNTG